MTLKYMAYGGEGHFHDHHYLACILFDTRKEMVDGSGGRQPYPHPIYVPEGTDLSNNGILNYYPRVNAFYDYEPDQSTIARLEITKMHNAFLESFSVGDIGIVASSADDQAIARAILENDVPHKAKSAAFILHEIQEGRGFPAMTDAEIKQCIDGTRITFESRRSRLDMLRAMVTSAKEGAARHAAQSASGDYKRVYEGADSVSTLKTELFTVRTETVTADDGTTSERKYLVSIPFGLGSRLDTISMTAHGFQSPPADFEPSLPIPEGYAAPPPAPPAPEGDDEDASAGDES